MNVPGYFNLIGLRTDKPPCHDVSEQIKIAPVLCQIFVLIRLSLGSTSRQTVNAGLVIELCVLAFRLSVSVQSQTLESDLL